MIKVTILGSKSKVHSCKCSNSKDSGCGKRFDLLNQVDEIKIRLKLDYPKKEIQLYFLDVQSDDVSKFDEILMMVERGLVSLPITIINGLPRLHGSLEYEDIKDVLDKKVD